MCVCVCVHVCVCVCRLFELGFLEQLKEILSRLPENRCALLYSCVVCVCVCALAGERTDTWFPLIYYSNFLTFYLLFKVQVPPYFII